MRKRFQKATCLLLIAAMLIAYSPAPAAKAQNIHTKNVTSTDISTYDTDYSYDDDFETPDSSYDDTDYDQSDDSTYDDADNNNDDYNDSYDDGYDNDNDYNDNYDDVVDDVVPDYSISTIKQTAITTTSLTVAWNKTSADHYVVTCTNNKTMKKITKRTQSTSYTFTGLAVGSEYYVTVTAYASSEEGNFLASNALTAYTKLKNLTGLHMTSSVTDRCYSFKWDAYSAATNYQVKLTEKKSGKTVKNVKTGIINYYDLYYPSINKIYIAHVRGIQKIGSNTYYTGWKKIPLIPQPDVKSFYVKKVKYHNTTSKKLALSWHSVDSATGYDIYISKKLSSGYKKVKSVSAKTHSLTLNKVSGKKINGKYYVCIVTKTKFSDKTCKSANNIVYNTSNSDFDSK